MSAEFLDSNVFVYAFDETDDLKRTAAKDLILRCLRDASGVISYQVVQEVLNVLTSKIANPVHHDDALRYFRSTLEPMWSIYPGTDLFVRGLEIRTRYGYGFYDSLIVSAAIEGGCSVLYSEDMQHGQLVETVRIVNPFRSG
ncbi:MAG: PIN domain-containing protein [Spirochaetota bacterium]